MISNKMSVDQKIGNLKDYLLPIKKYDSINVINTFQLQKCQLNNKIFFNFKDICCSDLPLVYILQNKFLLDMYSYIGYERYEVIDVFEIKQSENNKLNQNNQQLALCLSTQQYDISSQNKEKPNIFQLLILNTFDKQTYFISDQIKNISRNQFSNYLEEKLVEYHASYDKQEIDKINIFQNINSQNFLSLKVGFSEIINDVSTLQYLKSFTNIKQLYFEVYPYKNKEELFKQLPDFLLSYKNVQILELNLSDNKLTNFEMITLGNTISQFQQLECLKLNMNEIISKKNQKNSDDGWNGLFHGISKCQSLTQLTNILSLNYLNCLQIKQIMEHICNLLQLKKLKFELSQNQTNKISETSFDSKTSNLYNLEQLTLKLKDNFLTDEQGVHFWFENLNLLQNLKKFKLLLCKNNIGNKGYQKISQGISELKKLETLYIDLTFNTVGEEGANHLISSLSKCFNLKTLKIFMPKTGLSDNNIILFGDQLKQLQKLQNLKIRFLHYDITYQAMKYLIQQIIQLQNLSMLDLVLHSENSQVKQDKYLNNILIKNKRLVFLYFCVV